MGGSDTERSAPDLDSETKQRSVQFPSTVDFKTGDKDTHYAHSLADTDDGEEDEDYDWSTDEDLVDQEAKFEQKLGLNKPKKGWGPKRIATFFLSTLVGSTVLSCVIAAVPIILHFYYYKPHPTEARRYVTDNVAAWLYWTAANILISWYLALIVDIIPGICNILILAIWGDINENIRSRVELYNSAKDKFKPVLYGASGWLSWVIIFDGIFKLHDHDDETKSRASYTPRVYQAIQFLFFFTLVLSIERILSHMIAFAFHRKAFSERIDELQHDLSVIDRLRNYRPKRTHKTSAGAHRSLFAGLPTLTTPAFERTPFNWGIGGQPSNRLDVSRPGTPSGILDMHTDDEGHAGDTEAIGNAQKKKKSKKSWALFSSKQNSGHDEGHDNTVHTAPSDQPYNSNEHQYPPKSVSDHGSPSARSSVVGTPSRRHSDDEDEAVVVQAAKALKNAVLHDARNIKGKEAGTNGLGWDVTSGKEAKRLARQIYLAFKADHHRRYLIHSDFYPAYNKHEDAEEAFKIFDVDGNGDITRAEIKTKILKVYKDRRALTRSLRDVRNALKTLQTIMLCIALIILFFISLSVFNIGIGSSLTSFYTIGIAASFIFKNSASNAFDAVMFIFVTHPFDTGDRVFVDDENLIVKKMGLFATTFQRADGTETYYFNSQLFNKFIINARRSGKTFENMTLQVAWRTPLQKLDELEKCMKEWLATEENRWFEPDTAVTLQKIDYQRSLEFTMGIGHNGTWQDWGLRQARKTAFIAASQYYCKQLGIGYQETPQPVQFVDSTGNHIVSTPGQEDELLSPYPKSPNDEVEEVKEMIRPCLGFVPPPDKRMKLTRMRKSKYRKGHLQGMAAGGGDA
ncbi:hypothetical protein M422DRAFT_149686 [Sphaerobolus stellatus SS14]|nr:hypothetical protein M422DRAFT_149686 [Sphaerobolus stellatus SS14]